MLPPAVLTFFCVQLDACLLNLFWSTLFAGVEVIDKHVPNISTSLGSCWMVGSFCSVAHFRSHGFSTSCSWMLVQRVRPFTMSHLDVTVSLNLEACDWDIMICIYTMKHHESWCILPTPFHQKNLKHNFILWCMISSRFYPYEVQFWDHCCHQICTTQVQRW